MHVERFNESVPVGKRQNARPARRAIVVAGASAFSHNAFARVAPLNAINMLVADALPPADVSQARSAADVEVILPPA